nr:hypothetical protein CFP56_12849 [Quercus suber]
MTIIVAREVESRVATRRVLLVLDVEWESYGLPITTDRPLSGQKTSKSSLILVASNPKAISFLAVSNICYREKGKESSKLHQEESWEV